MVEKGRTESFDSVGVKPLFNVVWEGTGNPWDELLSVLYLLAETEK